MNWATAQASCCCSRIQPVLTPLFIQGGETNQQSADYHIQLDAYGVNAGDWASILTTAFRSDRAYEFFSTQSQGITPLYMEDAKQAPLVTGEQQYEARWTMVAHLQFKPSITDVQQSAATVTAGIINVDAEYPA